MAADILNLMVATGTKDRLEEKAGKDREYLDNRRNFDTLPQVFFKWYFPKNSTKPLKYFKNLWTASDKIKYVVVEVDDDQFSKKRWLTNWRLIANYFTCAFRYLEEYLSDPNVIFQIDFECLIWIEENFPDTDPSKAKKEHQKRIHTSEKLMVTENFWYSVFHVAVATVAETIGSIEMSRTIRNIAESDELS